MLIPKDKVKEAKMQLGKQAAEIIVKDLEIERWDEKNLKGCCPFHREDSPSFIWNEKNDSFHCFGCGINYGIIDHYMSFHKMTYLEATEKLFKETNIPFSFGEKGVKKLREYRYPKYEANENMQKAIDYLGMRGISKETIDYCDVTEDYSGNIIFNYYDENDVLCLVKYRPARKVLKGEEKSWCQKNADTKNLLFNMNRIDPTKPLVITEGECLKPDAELLTKNGWIKIADYDNQEIMSVDENLNGEFVLPIAYIKKQYAGNMYHIKRGGNYEITLTPKHNIVYIDTKNKTQKRKVCDMPETIHGKIPTTIKYDGTGFSLTNSQLALFIAVSADGTLDHRKNGNIYIRISFKKQRKIDRFENLLIENNINYTKTGVKKDYTFFGFTAPLWLNSKIFPHEWIYKMSDKDRKFFLEEIKYWDGNSVPNRKQIEYSSKEYQNCVFVQTIAHTSGFMSTIMKRTNKLGSWYKTSILFNKSSISWQKMYKNNNIKIEPYDGMVYCVTVPTGMILIRENGHISVTGNCDSLSIIESGCKNVVSVPFGASSTRWIEENFDWLEQFDKIVIWSDNDAPGINMRKEACARLGTYRTFYVDLPEEIMKEDWTPQKVKDANDVLIYFGKEKVLDLIEHAQEVPIENVIDLADVNDFDIETAPGLYSGFSELDDYIYKFLFGTVVVLTGRNGNGKSVLLNQMFIAEPLNQGHDVFVYSAEMSKPILKNWIELVLAGRKNVTLKNNNVHIIKAEAKKQMRDWYRNRIFVYDNDKDLSADSILDRVETVVRRFGVKVVVLDNLLTIDLKCSPEALWQEQKKFTVRLVNFACKYGILIVLVAHPKKTQEFRRLTSDDVAGSGDLTNLVHYVMAIHRYTKAEKQGEKDGKGNYKKGKEPVEHDCVIDLFKNRITGHANKSVNLYFDYPSYRFYTEPEELWKRFKWDKDTSPLPTTDPNEHSPQPNFMK